MYNFKDIENKWVRIWDETKPFKAIDFHPTKPKYYVLFEFYNISGSLHAGHLKAVAPVDAHARYKRFCGYNVLFPIGGDAFGLPAENAAIKTGINPKDFVKNGMDTVIRQSKELGFSFDYDRTICTSDPNYYKWTQWIFKQLYDNSKAYKKDGIVNYCPNCKTVLSNEDSQAGECDRCHGKVIQESRSVWFLKMQEYSDKLLKNVDNIDMADYLKELQRNWIGKSEGVTVRFNIVDKDNNVIGETSVYTTRVETIFGVTALVCAPENDIIKGYKNYICNYDEVNNYVEKTKYRSELDRMANQKNKTGVIIDGIKIVNPINNEIVPIYTSDYVLNNHGTGVVMVVPGHDDRDSDFAKEFGIPFKYVIENDIMVNSNEYNGMSIDDAREKISSFIVENNIGEKTTQYKMQDWSFNRQRYWGEPFPIVYCDKCGIVSLPEDELPLILPETDDYMPDDSGNSPISKITDWVNTTCPKCGGHAKRETDTMPNWAGSSWYWLRYTDPHNDKEIASMDKLKYWGSVDLYTGGIEHITRHFLYAFFWQNFLYEIGVVPDRNPFKKKLGNGLILDSEGKKLSKSSKNGVSIDELTSKYGMDTSRLHINFMASYEDDIKWTYDGINGITSFLNKVWSFKDIISGEGISDKHKKEINELIKKASESYESLSINTLIAKMMSFASTIKKDGFITREEFRIFMIILNPIAPFITSEMYESVFGCDIVNETWPQYEEIIEEEFTLPIQINGKTKTSIQVNKNITEEEILEIIKRDYSHLIKGEIKKTVYIKMRIINIIV